MLNETVSFVPATPSSESRIALLRELDLFDGPREPLFDEITRLAADALRAPVSLLTITDAQRQFFVSGHGLSPDGETLRETPIEASYCRFTIESASPLVICDARSNPLIATIGGPHGNVISYLATPVLSRDGVAIASLCVAGPEPRRWAKADLRLLEGLARVVTREIENRAAARVFAAGEAERKAQAAHLQVLVDNLPDSALVQYSLSPDGTYRFLQASDGFEQLTGIPAADALDDARIVMDRIPAPWRQTLGEVEARSAAELSDVDIEVPLLVGRRRKHWLRIKSRPRREADGTVVWEGVVSDITEQRRTEASLALRNRQLDLLSRSADRLLLADGDENAVLDEVCNDIARTIGMEMFLIYRPGSEPETLQLVLSGGVAEQEREQLSRLRYGQWLCGRVAEQREKVIVEDLQLSPLPGIEALRAAGVTSYAGFPLLAGDELIGTLCFVSASRTRLADGDVRTIETLCDQVATVLERTRLRREAEEHEMRMRLFVEQAPAAIAMFDRDMRCIAASSRWRASFDLPEDYASRSHSDLSHWLPAHLREAHLTALAGGELYAERERHITPEGAVRHFRWECRPWRDARGKIGGVLAGCEDVSLRIEHEARLLESEARHRLANTSLRRLVEGSPFGVYVVDADFRLAMLSHGARKTFENVRPLIGRDFGEIMRTIWHEPFASNVIECFRSALFGNANFHFPDTTEQRADRDDVESYDWKINPITMPDGRPGVVCHFYDLTERHEHEKHVRQLMGEINHRAKNMLALVQAIAAQTASRSPGEFLPRFGERLAALAAAQDLLVESEWRDVDLESLVRSQLAHFRDSLEDRRVTIKGPRLPIEARAAQAIGMAIHELGTNAGKYGALAGEQGRVAIRWRIDSDDVVIEWRESGGPPVNEPDHRGFGSQVIGRLLEGTIGCTTDIRFAAGGLVWTARCALARLSGNARTNLHQQAHRTAAELPDRDRAVRPRRVLVVEDEPLVALQIADTLTEAGFEVAGPAGSADEACALIDEEGVDAAVLDFNLGDGTTSTPVAQMLRDRRVPLVFVTGYTSEQLGKPVGDAPVLCKPIAPSALLRALNQLATHSAHH